MIEGRAEGFGRGICVIAAADGLEEGFEARGLVGRAREGMSTRESSSYGEDSSKRQWLYIHQWPTFGHIPQRP